jgi:hypothetical protein
MGGISVIKEDALKGDQLWVFIQSFLSKCGQGPHLSLSKQSLEREMSKNATYETNFLPLKVEKDKWTWKPATFQKRTLSLPSQGRLPPRIVDDNKPSPSRARLRGRIVDYRRAYSFGNSISQSFLRSKQIYISIPRHSDLILMNHYVLSFYKSPYNYNENRYWLKFLAT